MNIKKGEIRSQKENKKEEVESVQDIDKQGLNMIFKGEGDSNNFQYDSEGDNNPIVIFDNELENISDLKCVDIVFLVDCTKSMQPIFIGIKKFIRKLISDARKCLTQYLLDEPEPIRFGLVKYRDHPPQNKSFLVEVENLTSDFKGFKSKVMNMTAEGGGDEAEAVLDGLEAALSKINWRDNSNKFIYHLLDAPPHGKMFNENVDDGFPDECPCKIDYEELLSEMRGLDLKYNVVKLSKKIEKMITVFNDIYSLEVTTPDINTDNLEKVKQTP